MADSDILDCKIHELKEVQRIAWRRYPSLLLDNLVLIVPL
jgi:hypothetical protein